MKSGFEMKWAEVKKWVLNEYGNQFDGDPDDDPCFYCVHCEEPLYQCDFPYFRMNFKGNPICPICEEEYS